MINEFDAQPFEWRNWFFSKTKEEKEDEIDMSEYPETWRGIIDDNKFQDRETYLG